MHDTAASGPIKRATRVVPHDRQVDREDGNAFHGMETQWRMCGVDCKERSQDHGFRIRSAA